MSQIDICQELHRNFIDFSYEANSQRAFPDARDGLKPGQRACLWEMYVKGYLSNKPHVKSAKISGGTIASWWPHGNVAIYETFARMSQPWINNIPEVDWHGANGNQVVGSSPAADRYTEARLSKSAEDGMFSNMKKEVVPMQLNFSEDEEWPEVLPAVLPRLHVNGSQGIGVTIAQTWLPSNLTEFTEVAKEYLSAGTIDYTKLYPDFPSGGIIINKDDVHTIYETGKGKAVVRAKTEIKKNSILITELPYQVYVEPLITSIKELIDKEELTGIDDIYNKSEKNKLLVEIECDENPSTVLKKLFAMTDLQKSYSANQYALVGKTPQLLTFKNYLDIYISHNLECIVKEYQFDLKKAEARMEIVNGLLKALVHIDEIIALIKKSDSTNSAREALMAKYGFTDPQAKAIVNMRLGSLTKLESVELEKEKASLSSTIDTCILIIGNSNEQKRVLTERLTEFTKKYGHKRRTALEQIAIEPKEKEVIEIVPEDCVVQVTQNGYIKRVPTKTFKPQKRNGVGIKNTGDIVAFTCATNTIDFLMVFSSKGKMYKLNVDAIPEATNSTKGVPVSSLISMDNGETAMAYASLARYGNDKFVFFATKGGITKRVNIEDFKTSKKTGVIAINFKDDDSLAAVTFTNDEEIMLVTKLGMAIRIKSTDVPVTSRIAQGVKGINLNKDDYVIAALPIKSKNDHLIVVAENGYGKQMPLSEFTCQGRAGKGVACIKATVAGVTLASAADNILVIGDSSSICVPVSDLPVVSRISLGNVIIKNNKQVTAINKV